MAKTKTYSQNSFLVGKVIWGEITTGESATKKTPYEKFVVMVRNADGVGVVVEKTIWNPEKEQKDFVVKKREEFIKVIKDFNDKTYLKDIYVSIGVSPSRKTGKMFGDISVWEKDDGDYSIKYKGFVNRLETKKIYKEGTENEVEDVLIKFKKRNMKFSELTTTMDLEMIVIEKDGDVLTLSSEDVDYPTIIKAKLHEDIPNKAKQFTAYKFKAALRKGEKVQVEVDSSEDAWGQEAPESPEYSSDYIEIIGVQGIVKGLTMTGEIEDSSDEIKDF